MSFIRVLTPSSFTLCPEDGSAAVWSRRVDSYWLADQLEREAVQARMRRPIGLAVLRRIRRRRS